MKICFIGVKFDVVSLCCCRYNVTRRSFIGCMRKIEVFSRGTTKINLEDEHSLYIGMYRGCRLQVPFTRHITFYIYFNV